MVLLGSAKSLVLLVLNIREVKRELGIYDSNKRLPFCPTSTFLGVELARLLTFCHYLVALHKKLSLRVTLLRRLLGSVWGADTKALRTAALSLVHSTAEYCAPVHECSTQNRFINSILNDTLRIVTACQRPTPTDQSSILSNI